MDVSYLKAAEHFRKACLLDNGQGCTSLGNMYANGNGVPRDIKFGHDMFEKSCALNDARGCANLGVMYQKGISVKMDGKKL